MQGWNYWKVQFHQTAKGPTGPYEFVILLNPYVVIKNYMNDPANTTNENLKQLFLALKIRASEIGADDLLEQETCMNTNPKTWLSLINNQNFQRQEM